MPTATHEVIEGTWDEISAQATRLRGHRLVVVVLPDSGQDAPAAPARRMEPGMFPQLAALTDDDFKAAEYSGDPTTDDGTGLPDNERG
ncbi:MAG TPA: hypothetical protein VM490_03750 [Armatimonadaceae bacterium]|nr:hypothetical protein [Armatimonadaceae bacterium]